MLKLLVTAILAVGATAFAPSALSARRARRSTRGMATMEHETGVTCTGEKVTIVGATGYIGKAVVRESVRRGYPTTAVVRKPENVASEPKFQVR